MTQTERRIYLIKYLLGEEKKYSDIGIPPDEEEQKRLLRSLFNVRMPKKADSEFMKVQDEYLREEIRLKGITKFSSLTQAEEGLYLWRGDITSLRCDAIVNAANSGMLGCFVPCHGCIDNAVHTFAGIGLRYACYEQIKKQGHEEVTGGAKITEAFNLPCKYVLHTVGPTVFGILTEDHREALASCYRSCLELAEKNDIKSIAFCCISTGEFRFPNEEAAKIAVNTVREYRKSKKSRIEVIFNVFKEIDYKIYRGLLGADGAFKV